VKGTPKPSEFVMGTCFICKEPCGQTAYCHYKCACAYSDDKDKRIQEAKKEIGLEENK